MSEFGEDVPLVSVIIPSFNHEAYVQACILSVISQNYPNIELIIIDDGSSDDSVSKIMEMVPACKNRFARFELRHRPNIGLTGTLNEGLEWCEGDYFSTIASDDVMLPNKTALQVPYLLDNKKCAAVFGGFQYMDNHSKIIKKCSLQSQRHVFREMIMLRGLPAAPTGLIRKDLVLECGGYDPNIKVEDWYMWLKLTESEEYYFQSLPNVVTNYRYHLGNTVTKFRLMHAERIKILSHFRFSPVYEMALSNAVYLGALSIANREYIYPITQIGKMRLASVGQIIYVIVKSLTPKFLISAARFAKMKFYEK